MGEGWGKWGQFTSNLRLRWTIPVTAGGCQVSRRGHKGEAKGDRGELARGEGSKGNCAMYTCNRISMCIGVTERLDNISIVYIIIIIK